MRLLELALSITPHREPHATNLGHLPFYLSIFFAYKMRWQFYSGLEKWSAIALTEAGIRFCSRSRMPLVIAYWACILMFIAGILVCVIHGWQADWQWSITMSSCMITFSHTRHCRYLWINGCLQALSSPPYWVARARAWTDPDHTFPDSMQWNMSNLARLSIVPP